MRKLTGEGRKQGQIWEGLPGTNGAPALSAYLDSAGKPTIGWGHTANVSLGDTCTMDQANTWLDADLAWACASVEANVGAALNDNQFAALVWFAFNVGKAGFETSTLVKRLNELPPDYDAVPEQLARWNKVTSKQTGQLEVNRGLINRRSLETVLWLTPPLHIDATAPRPEPEVQRPTLAVVDISRVSPNGSQPTAPPNSAMQTTTGKGSAAAVVTGGTGVVLSALTQAQPVLSAVNGFVNGFGSFKSLAIVAGAALAFVSIGCMVWVYMHKGKSL